MLKALFARSTMFVGLFVAWFAGLRAAELPPNSAQPPTVAAASDEGETALKRFRIPKGFKVELVAAEPLLANPVAFTIDEAGRFYVCETFRLHSGTTDIRGHMNWLDDDLAARSVEDRVAMMKKFEGPRITEYTKYSDRLRLVWDSDDDGRADKSTVFADGFNGIADGIAAGVLARRGDVYFANIPNLWLLQDRDHDGVADVKKSLHSGFGVRVGFLGHDLHGLIFGPDGRLYFSIGDRGAQVRLPNGGTIENPETGAIYRCQPDGSGLEIFHFGLRNPQELAFDDFGNLWTGDNNSDGGDPARWVYAVEGGDSGWRIGWQFINSPNARGPWLSERMCYPQWEGQPASLLPPIANIANGPSGLACYPGVGLPERYVGHFFLCDFRGGSGSGVHSFTVKPRGAGFELIDRSDFIWEVLVTDGDFGYDGAFYLTDWVNGWNQTGKGRIYRLFDPVSRNDPRVAETKKLMAEGFTQRPVEELAALLAHADRRVRQEAQFALAAVGAPAVATLRGVAATATNRLARLHAIWGLGQLVNRYTELAAPKAREALIPLLADRDAEVRAQTAKVFGEAREARAFDGLLLLLNDSEPRPRFFAALALGRMGRAEAVGPLLQMLRENNDRDRYLRHAGVMGLVGCARPSALRALLSDQTAAVRMAAVLALRRLEHPDVAEFLTDRDPLVLAEAVRAINDLPIPAALPRLAALAEQTPRLARLPAGTDEQPGPRDPILRRVIDANFRLGTASQAAALVRVSLDESVPAPLRTEALSMLGEWARPSGRDRITGLWRPVSPRDPKIAVGALSPKFADLLHSGSETVRSATLRASALLGLKAGAAGAFDLLADLAQPDAVRLEALRALFQFKDRRLGDALKLAQTDPREALRKEATKLQAQAQPRDATAQLRAALDQGTLGEKQNAFATLTVLTNSPAADELLSQWLDRLLAHQVSDELQLDLLDAASRRTAPAVRDKWQRFERARPAEDNLRSYRECFVGGNAEEGKKVFFEKAEASCVRCHKINGEGGEVGPDLSGIGAKKDRPYLLESLTFPNAHIAEGFESVIVTMKNGTAYAGLVKSENDATLEINSPEDGLLKLNKVEIKSRERGLSAMPEELRQILTKHDLRNLVEYLAGLK